MEYEIKNIQNEAKINKYRIKNLNRTIQSNTATIKIPLLLVVFTRILDPFTYQEYQ
jgi:hypothetical protein